MLVLGDRTSIVNTGSITGGIGGNGATGASGASSAGDSGTGVNLASSGNTLGNTGTITGGAGNGTGAAGIGVMTNGNSTINNAGTISGGLNTDGVTHAAAIRFGGTGNALNLQTGSTLIGDIQLISGAGATIAAQAGGLTLGNNVVLGSGSLITFNSATSGLSVSGVVSGAGSVAVTGTGTIVLSGANTYTGGTTLVGGRLSVSSDANLGAASSPLTFNGGTLQVTGTSFTGTSRTINWGGGGFDIADAANNFVVSSSLGGSGGLTKSGAGTLTFTSSNSYTGGTTISAGTLQLGDGGTSGSITGDVTTNGTFAVNRSNTYTFGGTISGSGAFVQSGTGITILTGTNSYGGGTTLAAGTLSVASDSNLGTASGGLTFNGGTLRNTVAFTTGRGVTLTGNGTFETNADLTVSGVIVGGGSLTKTGTGTLTLTGNNTYTGGTTISNSTLQIGNGGTSGSITGDVTANGTFAVNRSDNYTLGGTISGSGAFAQRGTGTTTFTGNNSYTGGTTISQGTLQLGDGGTTGATIGDVTNNGTLAFNRSDAISFPGTISGSGNVVQLGAGTLTLNGQYTYTGATTVNAGKLVVGDDSHAGANLVSAVTVNSGATIGGIGTIGGLSVASGGTVTPGNSIGTLSVAGNVSFAAGSIYQVEANAAGRSDKIVASGTATLAGGNVLALAQTGTYAPQTVYTILTANGGVSGTFSDVTSSLTFLTPTLSYDANDVFLTLARNTTSLQSVAQTPNQIAVAGALDASGQQRDPLMVALLNQGAAGARQAFDALSGEVHASAQTAMLDDSRYLRDAVLGRLRQAAFAGSAGPMAALGSGGPETAAMDSLSVSSALAYAGTDRRAFPLKAPPLAPAQIPDTTFWAQGLGAWGRLNGDGNAAGMTRDLAGFFSGVDHRFATNWIAGIAGGYTSSSVHVGDRSSSADVQTAHLAGYVGASYGAFNLRGGAAASFSTLDTNRSIVFPGFFDTARARYDATTAQVFGEIGYGLTLGRAALEPFAGLAWAHLNTDSFSETGGTGAAALLGAANREDVGYSSLGARIATSFALDNGMLLTPRASVAWQYAFGDVTPTAALAFQGLGTSFTAAGVPLARNAALVEGGLDLRVTAQASVGIAYVGQLADRVQDHSVKASFDWKF
ncbi:hypothetical protein AS156_33870 [Bradyrhizobium macuxiense]|uniref:Autotransporter domain-containing protein n=1 Tax=Bradyrhizobium macuxiense TaxID=1755647 RepID=A0A120FQI3_9BRAD|nr:hypothetical protein AS156_33870 [Bradyrhizobium macuxiense]